MNAIVEFQIEDIDGCEFVECISMGKMLISHHQDFDGYYTGKIHVVYSDGSQRTVDLDKAQKYLDKRIWTVFR